ncbi:MAG: aldose 1-epimerase family protein [Sphingomonas sp.]|uniref:aldose 1-epimerase family protein n=1 Tax=Sphingomonas sp. TaxID=28214 RepID=UPI001B2ECEF7|nr:aldose 1-epimerase family protein [Sphingomonas sp.]MBO9622099.1 aldose 1-epimerase family protein [Sphingomonas sp.]
MIEIASETLSASINPFGAELSHLRDAQGRELMTDADPTFWSGRAPLLFPIVGRLAGDRYRLDGRDYPLPQHGFARRQPFAAVEQSPSRAVLRLAANDETRAAYPFEFTLDAAYTLAGATLAIEITATNAGDRDMPVSFGFHPAFAWPLPYDGAKEDHRITFAEPEPSPLNRIEAGLLGPADRPTPVEGRTLSLRDDLFTADALVWQHPASRALRYGTPIGPHLDIAFPDMPTLALWTKPGARFLCVEPWQGHADPIGFDGEIWDKPGMLRLAPGESRSFAMQVTLATD